MSQLKIASWNIFGGKDLKGVIELLKGLDADVIGLQEVLQEVDGTNNTAKMIADALGYSFVYETTKVLTPKKSYVLTQLEIERDMQWGNAIVSRYPISRSEPHILSDVRKRIALEAEIDFENQDIHVFSTHLVAYGASETSEVQLVQAKCLAKLIPEERAIVVGDFNAVAESDVMQEIQNSMVNTEASLAPLPTHEEHRIDYIFITKDLKTLASGTIESSASDHLPIWATIEV